MVDIHSHIIPGFDDGSRDMVESLEIARKETEHGTQTIFATPHVIEYTDIQDSARIGDLVNELNLEFAKNQIALKVVSGAELFPSPAVLRGLDQGLPITLAGTGKYVLLDLPHSHLPQDFDTVLFEIQARRITPILAHPERCPAFQHTPEAVMPYVERGIAFQINSGSFRGKHGEFAMNCARKLFKMRAAHFIASDAHRVSRFPLGEVAARLSEQDAAYVRMLTIESGQAVLQGAPLPALPEPVAQQEKKEEKKRVFRLFGRRQVESRAI